MPATPGWGSDTDHYDDSGKLLPDPGLQTAKKIPLAAQERARIVEANWKLYQSQNVGDSSALNKPEWLARRKGQNVQERQAENEALGITPQKAHEVGLQR